MADYFRDSPKRVYLSSSDPLDLVLRHGWSKEGDEIVRDSDGTRRLASEAESVVLAAGFVRVAREDMATARDTPPRYLKVDTGRVVPMDQAERDAVDADAAADAEAAYWNKTVREPRLGVRGSKGAEELWIRWGDGTNERLKAQGSLA